MKKFLLLLIIISTTFSATFPCMHDDRCKDLRTHIKKKKEIGIN